MDSIDVRNLYNAYRQVCESQQSLNESVDLDEARRSPKERAARAKELGDKQTINNIVDKYNSGRAENKQESPEKYYTEDLDTYDLVLEYLLDEGYCDDEQAAEVIMANMSEEWLAGIISEKEDNTIRLVYGKGGKGQPIKGTDGYVLREPKGGFLNQANKFRDDTRQAADRAAVSAQAREKKGRRAYRELTQARRHSIERLNASPGDVSMRQPDPNFYDTKRTNRGDRVRRSSGR